MTTSSTPDIDEATLEIIRNSLIDTTKEMEATVMNSSHTLLWQLAGDLSNAILTSDCELIAQPSRVIPVHIGSMTTGLSAALDKVGVESLEPGDVLITNNAFAGNLHLPDVLMAKPVFVDGDAIGFTAVRGHWIDIGGSDPTSHTPTNESIYQDGLIFPRTKVYEGGELDTDIVELIENNVRQRDTIIGDMKAQKAGVDHGSERLLELAEKYGPDTLEQAMTRILDRSESAMRNAIETVPDGTYSATDTVDSDGLTETPHTIAATVTVDDDELTVDLSNSDDQAAGGMNSPFGATLCSVYYGVLTTILPGTLGNDGTYRPIDVVARERSIVDPEFPAPVAGYHEPANRVVDVTVRALSEAIPERAYAAGDGSGNVFAYFGSVDDTSFQNMKVHGGGGGAHTDGDGNNVQRNGVGNTGLASIESEEITYPVRIDEYELVSDSGGAGRHRGGLTARKTTRFLVETDVMVVGDRSKTPPYGLEGGEAGQTAEHVLEHPDGTAEQVSPTTGRTRIEADGRFIYQPAGGGGYGDPFERDPELVLADVRDGYVSPEAARSRYGVVVERTDDGFDLDEAATEGLRSGNG